MKLFDWELVILICLHTWRIVSRNGKYTEFLFILKNPSSISLKEVYFVSLPQHSHKLSNREPFAAGQSASPTFAKCMWNPINLWYVETINWASNLCPNSIYRINMLANQVQVPQHPDVFPQACLIICKLNPLCSVIFSWHVWLPCSAHVTNSVFFSFFVLITYFRL